MSNIFGRLSNSRDWIVTKATRVLGPGTVFYKVASTEKEKQESICAPTEKRILGPGHIFCLYILPERERGVS
jgi:hypothetical protein